MFKKFLSSNLIFLTFSLNSNSLEKDNFFKGGSTLSSSMIVTKDDALSRLAKISGRLQMAYVDFSLLLYELKKVAEHYSSTVDQIKEMALDFKFKLEWYSDFSTQQYQMLALCIKLIQSPEDKEFTDKELRIIKTAKTNYESLDGALIHAKSYLQMLFDKINKSKPKSKEANVNFVGK